MVKLVLKENGKETQTITDYSSGREDFQNTLKYYLNDGKDVEIYNDNKFVIKSGNREVEVEFSEQGE